MMTLSMGSALRWAKDHGADERAMRRLRRWKAAGMTDAEKAVYEDYRTRFAMGRGAIELALAHGLNPGTMRQRVHRRGMDINDALRAKSPTRPDLVRVKRRDERWVEVDV